MEETSPASWGLMEADTLLRTRTAKVCLTCSWFSHHVPEEGLPTLFCLLHHRRLSQGDHLHHRCLAWSDSLDRDLSVA